MFDSIKLLYSSSLSGSLGASNSNQSLTNLSLTLRVGANVFL